MSKSLHDLKYQEVTGWDFGGEVQEVEGAIIKVVEERWERGMPVGIQLWQWMVLLYFVFFRDTCDV